uniref:adenine-specific methyltransferase EcoRI family protein n=1 Tax=Flavobacterium psychrophilum TaxID=96345 RepID=UPI003CC711AF
SITRFARFSSRASSLENPAKRGLVGGKTNGTSGLKTTVQQKKSVRIVTVNRTTMAEKKKNDSLKKAKSGKNDEFYTQLTDIEKELRHYKNHFKDKVVFCNCDDPRISNFFHYFSFNFESLELKKLITTCFKNQERDLFSENKSEKAIYLEYTGDKNGNRIPDAEEIGIVNLNGDGDFRSSESIELLKQADIIVTNPPFSLFREYVAQLIEHDKKFLIIGNQNNFTYKDIFKLVKENKIWAGVDNGGTKWFKVPDHYEIQTESRIKTENGQKYFSMGSVYWFTNLDTRKRHEDIILHKTYYGNENEYPTYDNYDAINVNKVADIPVDYEGLMGVPITFIDKYNPDQFEIIGIDRVLVEEKTGKVSRFRINEREIYARVVIRNKRL